jgi:hypothetical protein
MKQIRHQETIMRGQDARATAGETPALRPSTLRPNTLKV